MLTVSFAGATSCAGCAGDSGKNSGSHTLDYDGVIMMEGEAKKLISDPAVKESFLGGSVADTSKALRN